MNLTLRFEKIEFTLLILGLRRTVAFYMSTNPDKHTEHLLIFGGWCLIDCID